MPSKKTAPITQRAGASAKSTKSASKPSPKPSAKSEIKETAAAKAPEKTKSKSAVPRELTRPEKIRIISICNQKGGCGKTTTVINLAAGLAALGQRVLVVDLDSQANATTGLGLKMEDIEVSTFDLLTDPKNTGIEDIVLETEYVNLHVAPASIELSEFESRVASEIGRENRLKKALAPLNEIYDFILIDTPPSLGLLSVNALNAATEVFIAMQAHPFALDGLNLLLETIELIQEELNPSLKITGIVTTMFDNRTKISKEIMEKVASNKSIEKSVFSNVIRQNVKITEASKCRKPVMYYDALSVGAIDYVNLSKEVCAQHVVKSEPIQPTTSGTKKKADTVALS